MISLLLVSFFAGILTVLAPCVLPLLPVILGGGLGDTRNRLRPYLVIGSLMVSLLFFTLLLRATAVLIGISPFVWQSISGGILIVFGLTWVFPALWTRLMIATGIEHRVQTGFQGAHSGSRWEPILIGVALGPVFTSCSPTYALLLATILPAGIWLGLAGLVAYFLGLGIVLLGVVWFGRALIKRMKFLADPRGYFRRILGIVIIAVGILIITGFIKTLEIWIIDQGLFIDTAPLEQAIQNWLGIQS